MSEEKQKGVKSPAEQYQGLSNRLSLLSRMINEQGIAWCLQNEDITPRDKTLLDLIAKQFLKTPIEKSQNNEIHELHQNARKKSSSLRYFNKPRLLLNST